MSAFITAGGVKFMLLHDSAKSEEGGKNFFTAAYELYIKHLMNPFCDPDEPIRSELFAQTVQQFGKKYL